MKIKMLNFKKIGLSFGIFSFISLTIFSVISCSSLLGSKGKYDSINDNKIVIQTTWSTGGKAIESLRTITQKYNSVEKNKSGFMPVVVEKVQGGYGTIPSQAITKIQSQDTRTLPNLYIDYPTAAGMINPYKMIYDTSDVIKKEWFEKTFLSVNDNISGISPGGIYSVPLAKSSEALVYNKPLLKWMIEKMKTKGLIFVKPSNGPLNEIMNVSLTKEDKEAIEKQWGNIKTSADASGLSIKNNIFKDYYSLFNFIYKAQSFFTNPKKSNILGIDSVTNLIYTMSYLLTKNDISKFLFTKNKKSGWIDYKFLEKGSKQQELFQNIYEYIKKGIDKDAIWIGDSGEYGSNRLKKHQMAISISSTAGLHYSFSKESVIEDLNKSETGFALPINKYKSITENVNGVETDWNTITSIMSQGPSFNNIHINKEENDATKRFLKWFYTSVDEKSKIKDKKPVDYFSSESAYIVPLKKAFDNTSFIYDNIAKKTYEEIEGSQLGVKASYDAMKREIENQKDDNKNSAFVLTPIDDVTSSIRTMIDSKVVASKNSKANGQNSYNKNELWSDIRRNALIDQIIPDDGSLSKEYEYPNMKDRNFSDINWDKFSHIDGIVKDWKDGDTPVIQVISNSGHESVKSFTKGQKLSIRINGIDTPESSVKLGDIKYKFPNDKKGFKYEVLDEETMNELIDKYQTLNKPLAVKSNGYTNELSKDSSNIYGYWKNVWVDISDYEGYKNIENTIDKTFDLRNVTFDKNGKTYNLISKSALKEGEWGYKAKIFGFKNVPIGSKVRIATNGGMSYNRVVGSLFYDENLSKNYSVEIVKSGTTMPLISNPAEVLNKNSIFWHTGQAIADAFNEIYLNNPIGLFQKKKGYATILDFLRDTLLTHGVPDLSSLIKKDNSKNSTIYDYMKIRKPDKTLYKKESG